MTCRIVVIGRNSIVWKRLQRVSPAAAGANVLALGHAEVAAAELSADDVVWILSYSRDADENRRLFETLRSKGAGSYRYVSTATANVAEVTRCFGYPRAKADAEDDARRILDAEIVRIGVVYEAPGELPAGRSAATSLDEIAAAMFAGPPGVAGGYRNLFTIVDRPFRSGVERALFGLYGALLSATGRFPCLLRPVDLLLRLLGMRWYGYLYLSNRLWLRDRAGRLRG